MLMLGKTVEQESRILYDPDFADDLDEEDEEDDADMEDEKTTRDSHREALLCTVTAFALLEGQDVSRAAATLHLDLSFFIKHLMNRTHE